MRPRNGVVYLHLAAQPELSPRVARAFRVEAQGLGVEGYPLDQWFEVGLEGPFSAEAVYARLEAVGIDRLAVLRVEPTWRGLGPSLARQLRLEG